MPLTRRENTQNCWNDISLLGLAQAPFECILVAWGVSTGDFTWSNVHCLTLHQMKGRLWRPFWRNKGKDSVPTSSFLNYNTFALQFTYSQQIQSKMHHQLLWPSQWDWAMVCQRGAPLGWKLDYWAWSCKSQVNRLFGSNLHWSIGFCDHWFRVILQSPVIPSPIRLQQLFTLQR